MTVPVQTFKQVLAHWATGVTVVTTILNGERIGITASSFTSLSVDPPEILVCINKKLYTNRAIVNSGHFAVNILSQEQIDWGKRFAGLMPELENRFAGIETTTAVTGSPILPNVLAWVDCRVAHAHDGEDHTIFIGDVVGANARDDGDPLLYYFRSWRKLGQ